MATVVKVQCEDGEIYRLTLQEEPNFEGIVRLITDFRPELKDLLPSNGKGGGCALKYVDDDGDLCTLAPSTFTDFLDLHKRVNSPTLKLQLKMIPTFSKESAVYDGAPGSTARSKSAADPRPTEVPPQGPPPGLEKEDTNSSNGCNFGGGPGGSGGGPRRLFGTFHMLREAGMLTPAMFASLTVQWLPLLTQRVARKVDKINHVAKEGLDQTIQKILEIIQEEATATPGLEQHAAAMEEALSGDKGKRRLGEAILDLLKALRGLSFEVQARFCEKVASGLLPYLENLTSTLFDATCGSATCGSSWQHHPGSACAGCGAAPIVGPRFRCPVCPEYDLCGNCYPNKNQLHGNCPGCRKDFVCTISPGTSAKGKDGKGKGCAKTEKADFPCDPQAPWVGEGARGWMEAMEAAQQLGAAGMLPFHDLFSQTPLPFTGMEHATWEGQDPTCWQWPPCRGKGKGKKGKNKKEWKDFPGKSCKGKSTHESKREDLGEVLDDSELEKNVADLLELQLANEEVIRDLLVTHKGDKAQVMRLLTD